MLLPVLLSIHLSPACFLCPLASKQEEWLTQLSLKVDSKPHGPQSLVLLPVLSAVQKFTTLHSSMQ